MENNNEEHIMRSNGTECFIGWKGVRQEDIDTYEEMIDEILMIDDLDERMDDIERLLWAVEQDYPDLFDEVEDDIKEITFK